MGDSRKWAAENYCDGCGNEIEHCTCVTKAMDEAFSKFNSPFWQKLREIETSTEETVGKQAHRQAAKDLRVYAELREKAKDRFDLEQEIMSCWGVVEDLKMVLEVANEENISELIEALSVIYNHRFERLFATFEGMIKKGV